MKLEKGLEIQKADLEFWKSVLKDDVYEALEKHCQKKNKALPEGANGYAVFRGDDLRNFVSKYHPRFLFQKGHILLAKAKDNKAEYIVKVTEVTNEKILGEYAFVKGTIINGVPWGALDTYPEERERVGGFPFKEYSFQEIFPKE